MEQLQALTQAALDFAAWVLMQPAAAALVGGFAGGFVVGASKNRSAFVELGRGAVAGAAAWGVVTLIQAMIGGAA